jgi:hypothetical protein
VEAVWDSALVSSPDALWRICTGCTNPKDHSQHRVVGIPLGALLQIVRAGGRADPRTVDLA